MYPSRESDSTVLFQVRTGGLSRSSLRRFALRLRKEVAYGSGFCCLITSDAELQRMNREFRKNDYPTDVLSFPCGENGTIGDLAISIDRAREQAKEHRHALADELRMLMLHGVLHLTGLDHERDNGRMAQAEAAWSIHFGLPCGLIERVH